MFLNSWIGTGDDSRRESYTSTSMSRGSSMDQDAGVLSPRTLGELTESVRQLQIRRSPEEMSVSTISPTLYRGISSPEHPSMHIALRNRSASTISDRTRTGITRDGSANGSSDTSHYATLCRVV
ncbi:hypothetical protein AX774_g7173 [Zancudomyces culisetae]|uniref:Uncharacterized protein n=2 Tax=Zancudomyces culisetae TaxID=1213189 RepID=A0A1R1PEN1_ZANCU|nr:hypothetical protein AX774_g7173 [Zancudomyces culisetae]|eukprot:OMH79416.1 hypothetical protein AX774_g7173 [Zancudomyces culisetae]